MLNIFSSIFGQKLDPVVMKCYVERLPEKIEVSWNRNKEGYLIGRICIGDKPDETFFTQAKTAKEFVKMVNDALFVALDIKPEYINFFHAHIPYAPSPEELHRLNDGTIKEGAFGFQKNEECLQTA